jgi:2-iminobutanoate/2-iminopropanoate deaminase
MWKRIDMKKVIHSKNAPQAIGPYSQAVSVADRSLVFTAGQIGIDPETGELDRGGIEGQTRQVLVNLSHILAAAGSGFDEVVKTTVYLRNLEDFVAMNRIYGSFFAGKPPARTTVQVTRLPKDALIEIDAVAIAGNL